MVLRFGKYYETVGPGLNIYFPPIDKKYMENVTRERAYTEQGQMLTEDENIVEVPLTVQYKISNLQDFVLNVDQPEISLQHRNRQRPAPRGGFHRDGPGADRRS